MDSSTIIHEENASRKRKVHQVESPSIHENDVDGQKSPLTDSNAMNAVDQSNTSFVSTGQWKTIRIFIPNLYMK